MVSGAEPAPGSRAVPPEQVWALLAEGRVRVLDLRTGLERRRYGAPPGSRRVSLLRHAIRPDPEAIYLCQHAVRSKAPVRRGAREVAGGFVAWLRAGLPVEGGPSGD
jgi:rhodanese-related sulfurtransferase